MDFEEIFKKVCVNSELDKKAKLPEKYVYERLENLYYDFKQGRYSKEKCSQIKNEIRKEYESSKAEYEKVLEVYKEYNQNRIENELILNNLEKETDKDKLLKICFKLIENYIKDDSFVERNTNRLGLN